MEYRIHIRSTLHLLQKLPDSEDLDRPHVDSMLTTKELKRISYTILVKNKFGESREIRVSSLLAVGDLKKQVKASNLLISEDESDEPFLIFAEEVLQDDLTLEEYPMVEGSVVNAV